DRLAVNVRRAGERRTLGDLDVLPAVHAGDVGEPVVLREDLRDAGLQRSAVEDLGDEEAGLVEAEHPHRDGDEHHDDAQDQRQLRLLRFGGCLRQRRVARRALACVGTWVARRAVALGPVVLVGVALVGVALGAVGRGAVALRRLVGGTEVLLWVALVGVARPGVVLRPVARRRVALPRVGLGAVVVTGIAVLRRQSILPGPPSGLRVVPLLLGWRRLAPVLLPGRRRRRPPALLRRRRVPSGRGLLRGWC